MTTAYPQIPMDTLALVRIDILRILRDAKTIVSLMVVIGAPLAATRAGASFANVFMLLALFLPVAVGWSWGTDLAGGRLVQLASGRYGAERLFWSRLFAFGSLLILVGVSASIAGAPVSDVAGCLLFAFHLVLLGFCLATWLRSAEAGWLPIFAALAGVWLPLLFVMKQSGPAAVPRWLRWLMVVFLPQFGKGFDLYTASELAGTYACLSAGWIALTLLALRRPETIDRRAND